MIIKELQFGVSNHGKPHTIFCNKEITYLWGGGVKERVQTIVASH